MHVNRTKLLLKSKEKRSNHEFLLEQLSKITRVGDTSRKDGCVGPRTKRQHFSTSQVLAWIIISRKRNLNQLENYQKYAHKLPLKCLYLARIGRIDILWSMSKLARWIAKWTNACDKRLNRLISKIHHTSEYKQYCHVCNTAKQCRLGLFQDSDFAGDLEDSKSTSGGHCAFLEVIHLFQ